MPREPIGPVIAGVDDSPIAAAVVDLAAREAAGRSAPLILLHVTAAAASGSLDAALARVRRAQPGCTVTAELAAGDPADVLVARSAGASVVVLGHSGRGRRRIGRSGPGSVALRVLGRAEAPVIVCRRRFAGTPGAAPTPVLVGVDGTPGSEAAVEFGFAEAALHGAPLLAMHVWPPRGTDCTEAEGAFLNLLETWSGKYPEVPVQLAVRHGLDVAIVLAAASRSARLAVVSAYRTGAYRLPPGSTLAAFIDRAGCPVAVAWQGG